MTYVPKPETSNWEAPPGLAPWRELSDEEFDRLAEDLGPEIARWYDRAGDAAPARARASSRREERGAE